MQLRKESLKKSGFLKMLVFAFQSEVWIGRSSKMPIPASLVFSGFLFATA